MDHPDACVIGTDQSDVSRLSGSVQYDRILEIEGFLSEFLLGKINITHKRVPYSIRLPTITNLHKQSPCEGVSRTIKQHHVLSI